jgi:hypothetical protein
MKSNITAEIVKITPEMATEWLSDRWGEQRTIRQGYVKRLASDMEAGRFRVSPDAILRIKGKLANGQHRLNAVVSSGKAQTFLVMESNDEELYKTIDAGMRRSVSDGLIGIPYATATPSISRWVQAYEAETIYPSSNSGSAAHSLAYTSISPTQCALIDYCISNQTILIDAAAFVNPLYEQTRLLPMSIGGAIYVLASSRDGYLEKAKCFLRDVYLNGGQNAAGDLRNRLIINRGNRASKGKIAAGYIFGITIKAFKSYVNGTRPGTLKWVKGEMMPSL